jgi:hypothetical protein
MPLKRFVMKKQLTLILVLFSLLLSTSCKEKNNLNPVETSARSLEQMYMDAVYDAVIVDSSEIVSTLIAIIHTDTSLYWNGTSPDDRVLVVTWTKYFSNYPVNDTIIVSWGDVWVTVVPEMQRFFHTHPTTQENITLRSEQLLGLPMNKGYTHFVELWVKPDDLFRPSPDNEITDRTVQLDFPTSVDSSYRSWFSDNFFYSYFTKKIPWTRLGYTYDWGNLNSEVGLSEFVIKKNARVIVHSVTATNDYLLH